MQFGKNDFSDLDLPGSYRPFLYRGQNKILMAFCVVAIHTYPLEACKNVAILSVYSAIVRYAVPFFFLSTGFLLANRFDGSNAFVLAPGFMGNVFFDGFTGSLFLAASSMSLFKIVSDIELPKNSCYLMMRKMITVIYLVHMYIWSFYYWIVYREKVYGADSFIVVSIVSVLVAYIWYFIQLNRQRIAL